MMMRILNVEPPTLIWCVISLSFMILSFVAIKIFWRGVKRASALTVGTFRRVFALDLAWAFLIDELWRLSQHIASFFAGFVWFFITYVPPPSVVPRNVQIASLFVLFVLFYINLASGINTIRTLRTWYRREKMLNLRYLKPKDRVEDHD